MTYSYCKICLLLPIEEYYTMGPESSECMQRDQNTKCRDKRQQWPSESYCYFCIQVINSSMQNNNNNSIIKINVIRKLNSYTLIKT